VPKVPIPTKQHFEFTILVDDEDRLEETDRKEGAPASQTHRLYPQRGAVGRRRCFAIGKVAADRTEVITYNWASALTDRLASFVDNHTVWVRQRDALLQRILYQEC